jgi:phosphoserine phosphatase RsbU/P
VKDLSDCRVLIVDDTRANVDILVHALQREYHLSVALDGEAALRSVKAAPPDLILLDIMMPGLDGYEVCRRLKADAATRDIPVVFLSALHEVEDKAAGFEVGAADYITKPFEVAEVKARARALLRAKAYQDAVHELMQSELRVAREIQMGVVPRDFARFTAGGRLDVFACLEPAREVGGDLYDVFAMDGGRLCLVTGDVSGKGIPSALFMVMATTLTRTMARLTGRPDHALARVNDELAAENPLCMFVTLFCGVLNPATGVVEFASGGHPPPVIVRPGNPARLAFEMGDPLVGAFPAVAFTPRRFALEPGDLLVAYTDGVTEALAPDGAQFGEERLLDLLGRARPVTAQAAVETVLGAVREFAAGADPADDIAILAVRYLGAAGAAALELTLRAVPEDAARAAEDLGAFCRSAGATSEAGHDILVGLDEILANILQHGYRGNGAGEILVRARRVDDAIELEIRDRAPAFNPIEDAPRPAFHLPIEERPLGGIGVHLVRRLMDRVEYARENGENRIRLTRHLSREGPLPPG